MSRRNHYLKTLKEYYSAVEDGSKPFEVRFNDRDFKVGDRLILEEIDGVGYTGRALVRTITYVLDTPDFCKVGYVVLGIAYFEPDDDIYYTTRHPRR
jgi:hypothetical protein